MDPLTQTLAGVLVAKAFPRPKETAAPAPSVDVAVWVGLLAANLPDLDVLLPPVVTGEKEEFMLFHRGWSHTLLMAPLLAALAVLIVRLVRREKLSGGAENKRLWLIGLAAVGAHLFFDSLNDFGLHLLAPLDGSWRYGDVLYMAEPLLWAAMLPLAALSAGSWKSRSAWILTGVVVLGGFAWLMGPVYAVAPVAVAIAVAFAQRRFDHTRIYPLPTVVAVGLVLLSFVVPRFIARATVKEVLAESAAHEQLVELSSTAAPGNPLCWRVLSLSIEGDNFISREAYVSLGPARDSAMSCYPHGTAARTAPLVAASFPARDGVAWKGEFRGAIQEINESALDCRIGATASFVRIPFWTRRGHLLLFGDLRYDLTERRSWAEVELANQLPTNCPPRMWRSPIQELLDSAKPGDAPVSRSAPPPAVAAP